MKITFKSARLQKLCNSVQLATRQWARDAPKVLQRLTELAAAENLFDIGTLPPARCHQLKGSRKGQFAISAGPKLRVAFKPDHDPVPQLEDGGIDRKRVSKIKIIEIEDYHGE